MEHQEDFLEYQDGNQEYRPLVECQEAFMQYQRTFCGIQWRSMECKDAMRQYQEAFMQYEEAFLWNTWELLWNTKLPGSSMEYQGSVQKYLEAPWNNKRL